MTKIELKERLKLLGKPLAVFLRELNYNPNHLKRYRDDKIIPTVLIYALFLLEKDEAYNKLQATLDGHKKILSILVKKEKNTLKLGDMAFFWNKNSDSLLLTTYSHFENGFYFTKSKVKKGFKFAEKFTGEVPTKFHVKFYSSKLAVMKKKDLNV